MIRHYLTFAHEAAALEGRLLGWHLAECWSQERNALSFRFVKGEESRFLEVALDLKLGHLLVRDHLPRARRNTIDFFSTLLGAPLSSVSIDEGERVIRLDFAERGELALFFFGPGGGNALRIVEGSVVESFRRYGGEYDEMLARGEPEEREPGDLASALATADVPIVKGIAGLLPELGRRLVEEAVARCGVEATAVASTLEPQRIRELLAAVDLLYAEAQMTEVYHLYRPDDREPIFSLVALTATEEGRGGHEIFSDIGEAVRAFRAALIGTRRLLSLRDEMRRSIAQRRDRLERALANRLDAGSHLAKGAEWEEMGNLLLASLHMVPRGVKVVDLDDWHGGRRSIPLDEKLSPADNAERYFRKARGAREQAARAERGIDDNRRQLAELEALAAAVEGATSVDALESIKGDQKGLFMKQGNPAEEGSAERFRKFEAAGLEIYAGKNASNNDELTVRFARPNDYWFHARGTSGSHVVLRWGDAKAKPPKEAIRAAASVAAYYSGAKNAKLVPVAYTLKKYVRKPRGAHAGSVVMEREEVVMVEPRLPE